VKNLQTERILCINHHHEEDALAFEYDASLIEHSVGGGLENPAILMILSPLSIETGAQFIRPQTRP
jgi:hypothetical protein